MTRFASRILKWYAQHARVLPWRRCVTPYRIWISEVMLQQTRVETVIPYFARWMRRFPSIRSLARARSAEILRIWEGLGYYSRGLNLHRAARIIIRDFNGRLPENADALRELPGVGAYSAAAIASIAFGKDEATLDANARRILTRVFYVTGTYGSSAVEKQLRRLATSHLATGRAGEFNQALMDLGSLVCLPRLPRCGVCPVEDLCEARKRGAQNQLPARGHRRQIPHVVVGAAVVRRQDKVLVARRQSSGLLGGLWEFPNAKLGSGRRCRGGLANQLPAALQAAYALEVSDLEAAGVIQHAYSHFRVTVHAFRCSTRSAARRPGVRWVRIDQLSKYPMGKVDRAIARHLLEPPD